MDFRSRRDQPANVNGTPSNRVASAAPAVQPISSQPPKGPSQAASGSRTSRLTRIAIVVLLFAIAALMIFLSIFMTLDHTTEQRAIAKSKYQAVFLNNGQVYFGNIKSVTRGTMNLQNIYYLQTNGTSGTANTQASTASNVSLVKLGCELHAPYDQMLINDDQVIFWENIKDDSQVVKAINQYKKSGSQSCSTASQSSTQQAPSTTTPTTGTGTTTKP